ncbi:hypothetical protein FUAX_05580 [Fulvitalea axinellae]|uniref:ABC transporter ATPase n=1 Tax=Fulvitalea axinellae TaxID=1182444 RepID=A0AAU9D5P9_9BACT|nr:hypothetical protein FUAX_05580 [Fulvitalea axinellae]
MLLPFENMPDNARVWIFQSNRPFGAEEADALASRIEPFLDTWQAHSVDLNVAYRFEDEHFLIVAVNEDSQQATGCSIDGLTRFVKSLAENGGPDFMDRAIAYNRNGEVRFTELSQIRGKIANGEIGLYDLVYNNALSDLDAFRKGWKLKAQDSWMKRYF